MPQPFVAKVPYEASFKDLHEAASELQKAHPGLTVHTYRVRPDGEKIRFEPISSI